MKQLPKDDVMFMQIKVEKLTKIADILTIIAVCLFFVTPIVLIIVFFLFVFDDITTALGTPLMMVVSVLTLVGTLLYCFKEAVIMSDIDNNLFKLMKNRNVQIIQAVELHKKDEPNTISELKEHSRACDPINKTRGLLSLLGSIVIAIGVSVIFTLFMIDWGLETFHNETYYLILTLVIIGGIIMVVTSKTVYRNGIRKHMAFIRLYKKYTELKEIPSEE